MNPTWATRALIRKRVEMAKPYIRGDILDLGCGYAEVLKETRPGTRYVGIEANQTICDWLELNRPGGTFLARDLDRDPLNLEGTFQTVLMLAILEHLDRPERILKQLPDSMKESGILVITTPTPLGASLHWLAAKLGLVSRLAAEEHGQIYDQTSLRNLLSSSGFEMIEYRTFLVGGNQLAVASPVR